MKDKIISFIWQHVLLLLSLFVMTLGVTVCVRSQLGSSVISTIPYVMESAGKVMDAVPDWTIGTYTILMNAINEHAGLLSGLSAHNSITMANRFITPSSTCFNQAFDS